MPRNDEFCDSVEALKRRLSTAFDVRAALVALSGADMATLRQLEWDTTGGWMRAMSDAQLRAFLAETHVRIKRGKVLMSTGKITSATIQRWALDIIQLWFPGYTDWDDEVGGQFKIDYMGPHGTSGIADRYQVSTIEGRDPRVFKLTVAVLEACD